MKRPAKKYKNYLSEPSEESIHMDYKVFCSLHYDFYNKAPGGWTKATDQEIYDMCKFILLRKTAFSKGLLADKQRRVLLDLTFRSPEMFAFLSSSSGLLQATGETRLWSAANRLYGSH